MLVLFMYVCICIYMYCVCVCVHMDRQGERQRKRDLRLNPCVWRVLDLLGHQAGGVAMGRLLAATPYEEEEEIDRGAYLYIYIYIYTWCNVMWCDVMQVYVILCMLHCILWWHYIMYVLAVNTCVCVCACVCMTLCVWVYLRKVADSQVNFPWFWHAAARAFDSLCMTPLALSVECCGRHAYDLRLLQM